MNPEDLEVGQYYLIEDEGVFIFSHESTDYYWFDTIIDFSDDTCDTMGVQKNDTDDIRLIRDKLELAEMLL